MRAYYLNPNIDAEGLKELDALSDKHAKVCKDSIASMLEIANQFPRGSKEADAYYKMAGYFLTQMMFFG